MRYFSRAAFIGGKVMARKDSVLLVSRALAVLLTVFALREVSYLPEFVHSFVHYLRYELTPVTNMGYLDYMRHYYLLRLAFLITRIIGYSLMARWLYKGGPDIEELLLPPTSEENPVQD
jgi:ABC-type anion transport system duplicated permease subunit